MNKAEFVAARRELVLSEIGEELAFNWGAFEDLAHKIPGTVVLVYPYDLLALKRPCGTIETVTYEEWLEGEVAVNDELYEFAVAHNLIPS